MTAPDDDAGQDRRPAGDGPGRGGSHDAPDGGRGQDAPDPEELERTATPATVRRAPRYRAFVLAGALAGALVGVVLVLLFPAPTGSLGTTPVAAFVGLSLALVGALVGAVLAVLGDRTRETRRSRRGERDAS